MSKWLNFRINKFMGTDFTIRETELSTMFTTIIVLVAVVFVMYNAIFPNI